MKTLADYIETLFDKVNKVKASTTRLIDFANRLCENNCIDYEDYMRRTFQISYQTGYAEGIIYAIDLFIKTCEEDATND